MFSNGWKRSTRLLLLTGMLEISSCQGTEADNKIESQFQKMRRILQRTGLS